MNQARSVESSPQQKFTETMKLLIAADLHFRLHWFRWLIDQAPVFDLVCIAGDLLDIFNSETRAEQARGTTRLIRELADIVPVGVSQQILTKSPSLCLPYNWMPRS